ncbi:plasmid partition protein ParG [Candidatus Pantoea bituminis]|uniref:plasmid partition protein ParG n=1 Tax=Candidatus Pantoea bituminis TaxID=2831036 RepID=UPI001C05FBDB|nr:plasmid partition protein ParG [Pantoea bituminis]
MTGKKVNFSRRAERTVSADAWVENREPPSEQPEQEKMKRLTIDVTESLHKAIKSTCASRGTKIADEVRELLREKYQPD